MREDEKKRKEKRQQEKMGTTAMRRRSCPSPPPRKKTPLPPPSCGVRDTGRRRKNGASVKGCAGSLVLLPQFHRATVGLQRTVATRGGGAGQAAARPLDRATVGCLARLVFEWARLFLMLGQREELTSSVFQVSVSRN